MTVVVKESRITNSASTGQKRHDDLAKRGGHVGQARLVGPVPRPRRPASLPQPRTAPPSSMSPPTDATADRLGNRPIMNNRRLVLMISRSAESKPRSRAKTAQITRADSAKVSKLLYQLLNRFFRAQSSRLGPAPLAAGSPRRRGLRPSPGHQLHASVHHVDDQGDDQGEDQIPAHEKKDHLRGGLAIPDQSGR